jgi:hypothetical protein
MESTATLTRYDVADGTRNQERAGEGEILTAPFGGFASKGTSSKVTKVSTLLNEPSPPALRALTRQ